jgi:hypothetical protein
VLWLKIGDDGHGRHKTSAGAHADGMPEFGGCGGRNVAQQGAVQGEVDGRVGQMKRA